MERQTAQGNGRGRVTSSQSQTPTAGLTVWDPFQDPECLSLARVGTVVENTSGHPVDLVVSTLKG